MEADPKTDRVRLAVGIFHNAAGLRRALHALMGDGFGPSAITVVVGVAALEHMIEAVPDTERIPGGNTAAAAARTRADEAPFPLRFTNVGRAGQAGPVLASYGEWARRLAERARAANGDFGLLFDPWIGGTHARLLQRQIENGAATLWIRVCGTEEETRACRCLLRHTADAVQLHDIANWKW